MKNTGIYFEAGSKPWPHELRAARILVQAGYSVEFIAEKHNLPTADIKLDGIEYEIKSPEHFTVNTLEHTIKDALKQSPNIIIDMSRMKKVSSDKMLFFLLNQVRKSKQIKRMMLITKQEEVVDIFELIR